MNAFSAESSLIPARISSDRIRSLLAQRRPGYGLPGMFYTDPDVYAMDLAVVFEHEWIFVGASCEFQSRAIS